MGLLWDLLQQSQISRHADRTATVEERLETAEAEVVRLSNLVHELIARLEAHLGTDLDSNGRVGGGAGGRSQGPAT